MTPKRPHYYFQLKLCISSLLCRHNNKYSTTTICSTHRVPLRRFLSPRRRRRRRQSRRKTNTTKQRLWLGRRPFCAHRWNRSPRRRRRRTLRRRRKNGDAMMPPRPRRRRRRRPRRRNREAAAAAAAAADKIYSKEAARKRRSIPSFSNGRNQTRNTHERGVESENDRTVLGTVRRVSQRLVEATESVDE